MKRKDGHLDRLLRLEKSTYRFTSQVCRDSPDFTLKGKGEDGIHFSGNMSPISVGGGGQHPSYLKQNRVFSDRM